MTHLVKLPYFENSATLFSLIEASEWSIFLDSGYPSKSAGRFDILTTDPIATVVYQDNKTIVSTLTSQETRNGSPFDVLRQVLKKYNPKRKSKHPSPFHGGALGYFSYDLARSFEKIPNIAEDKEQLPDMAIGIYTWAIIVDHKRKETHLTGEVKKPSPLFSWEQLIELFSQQPHHKDLETEQTFSVKSPIVSNFSYAQYEKAFKQIKEYILSGDCYQINLTQRFSASAEGNPWVAYKQLRSLNPAPYSAYINTPFGQILSSSPECFLEVIDQQVETKPVKGTRPRSPNIEEDLKYRQDLLLSKKDRAENIMIVDLLRNDISRVCQTGTIKADRLFEVESYSTVHHLVSTINGQLSPKKDALNLLEACFPGGSITGAPKIRAMEIIESLEPHRRGIYCGSIGYIDFNGNMDTNICIRTLIYNQKTIRFWVGGGIIHDSIVEDEYQETFDKGKALLALLKNCQSKL